MDSKDKKSHGEELVARLLTPQEADSVAGGEFTTYAQSGGGTASSTRKAAATIRYVQRGLLINHSVFI